MKILFYGDSITDAGRNREDGLLASFGHGYVHDAASILLAKDAGRYEIINRGISGNRIVDLYARVKEDCWNLQPDVLSILIGVNDVWHELYHGSGVDIKRFEKVYRNLIEETLERLPEVKIILCEPFVLKGYATQEKYDEFLEVKEYAKVVKKLAQEYNFAFLPLQEKLDEAFALYGEKIIKDGVHPLNAGAALIAKEWVKLFEEKVEK